MIVASEPGSLRPPSRRRGGLLSEADRYARRAGISRSRLVAKALRLRMDQPAG